MSFLDLFALTHFASLFAITIISQHYQIFVDWSLTPAHEPFGKRDWGGGGGERAEESYLEGKRGDLNIKWENQRLCAFSWIKL